MTTLFQTVQSVVIQLNIALQGIQGRASQNNLPPADPIASCHGNYQNLIRTLRGSVRKAADTADFLINNVFRDLLSNGSAEQKRAAIDRFVQSLGSKATSSRNLKHEIERLRNNLLTGAATLHQLSANPAAISNQFITIIDGIQSIDRFYQKVGDICTQVRGQVDQVATMTATIRVETRWLAAVSQDFKAFNPVF
ncbi:hypothetical protein QCA50_013545 [Cerrena zonata]|uniref:Uncharacterized protein n=1 Tax=Cerrena zonata TaxID=2478898 RepID=A0AAW0G047_9APHY